MEFLNFFIPLNGDGDPSNYFTTHLLDSIRAGSLLATINSTDSSALRISVFNRSGDYVSTGSLYETDDVVERTLTDDAALSALDAALVASKSRAAVLAPHADMWSDNADIRLFTLVRPLSTSYSSKTYGYIAVQRSVEALYRLPLWAREDGAEYALLDAKGQNVSPAAGLSDLGGIATQLPKSGETATFSAKLDGRSVSVFASKVGETGWTLIRVLPTGLLDPEVIVRPVQGQVDDLLEEVRVRAERDERVLVTTLTKRMAEDLTEYMEEMGIRVRYLHSDIETLDRIVILRDLRLGKFDVLVGINLLREGLDLPEVSLVAILDADKEGFLRSETSLIQTIGRAARNVEGKVIMYADRITDSMKKAIGETERRREKQMKYNQEHNITPESVKKAVRDIISIEQAAEEKVSYEVQKQPGMTPDEIQKVVNRLEKEMLKAAAELEFEQAAKLRDELKEWQRLLPA
jgi:hypothetical protein